MKNYFLQKYSKEIYMTNYDMYLRVNNDVKKTFHPSLACMWVQRKDNLREKSPKIYVCFSFSKIFYVTHMILVGTSDWVIPHLGLSRLSCCTEKSLNYLQNLHFFFAFLLWRECLSSKRGVNVVKLPGRCFWRDKKPVQALLSDLDIPDQATDSSTATPHSTKSD